MPGPASPPPADHVPPWGWGRRGALRSGPGNPQLTPGRRTAEPASGGEPRERRVHGSRSVPEPPGAVCYGRITPQSRVRVG